MTGIMPRKLTPAAIAAIANRSHCDIDIELIWEGSGEADDAEPCQTERHDPSIDVPNLLAHIAAVEAERDAALADNAALLTLLDDVADYGEAHHRDEGSHVWLHDLTIVLPDWIRNVRAQAHPGAPLLTVAEAATELVDAITHIQASPYQSDSNYWGILGFRSDAHAHALLTGFDQAHAAVDALRGRKETKP